MESLQPASTGELEISEMQPTNRTKQLALLIGAVSLMVISSVVGYYFGTQHSANTASQEILNQSPSPQSDVICTMDAMICPDGTSVGRTGPDCEFAPCPDTDGTDSPDQHMQAPNTSQDQGWTRYQSSTHDFSVRIPESWRFREHNGGVGFGPQEVREDTLFAVLVSSTQDTTTQQLIDESGKQFPDRIQTTNEITVNGMEAIEVITTTPSIADWYARMVIIVHGSTIYTLSNGAMSDVDVQQTPGTPEDFTFEQFLQSFESTRPVGR